MNISLPTKKGNPNTDPVLDFKYLVVVGANGSGKTRFGARIEELQIDQTHRISAQKSLTFPAYVSPTSKERANKTFRYGSYNEHYKDDIQYARSKKDVRWGGNLNTFLLNDYDKLLILLHTEEYEDSLNYKEGRIPKPTTKLDRIQTIWQNLLPHRKLIKSAGIIEAGPIGDEPIKYNASEMSDGERVIFYLIGEVICAEENSIIVIDEPEMHIHKSLVKSVFDLIENERPDCSFIYLTHDLDFTFTRHEAVKIWAKSYEGNNVWDYEILAEDMPIPEQLYLEVLGSRKSVLFLEGEESSIDYRLYEHVYLEHTLVPLGNCEKVIQSVKAFNEQNSFHHIQSNGIIDRDRRINLEIAKLNESGTWVLDVAEIENIFLIEAIVKLIASHMEKDSQSIFDQIKTNLFEFFNDQLDAQVILHFKGILRREFYSLSNFTAKTIVQASPEIDSIYGSINKEDLFESVKLEFERVLQNTDYDALLRLFNLKGALIPKSKICELCGISNKRDYVNLVISILKSRDARTNDIRDAIDSKIVKNVT